MVAEIAAEVTGVRWWLSCRTWAPSTDARASTRPPRRWRTAPCGHARRWVRLSVCVCVRVGRCRLLGSSQKARVCPPLRLRFRWVFGPVCSIAWLSVPSASLSLPLVFLIASSGCSWTREGWSGGMAGVDSTFAQFRQEMNPEGAERC